MEQAGAGGHGHDAGDLSAAAGLAEDGDVGGIAAEAFAVVVDPGSAWTRSRMPALPASAKSGANWASCM